MIDVGQTLGDDALQVGVDQGPVQRAPSPTTPRVSAIQLSARLPIAASIALRSQSGKGRRSTP
jgi:hypothetical protein